MKFLFKKMAPCLCLPEIVLANQIVKEDQVEGYQPGAIGDDHDSEGQEGLPGQLALERLPCP